MLKRICVFCGSSEGRRPAYTSAARALGNEMARRNIELVYGGASIGLMGEIANAVLSGGGRVIGVIPEVLMKREVAHKGLSELKIVKSMHARKQLMEELSDAFIAMPGGFGTLDELCEIVTWSQLGIHAKPFGVLETEGFFAPFLSFLDGASKEGFISTAHRARLLSSTDPADLLDLLAR